MTIRICMDMKCIQFQNRPVKVLRDIPKEQLHLVSVEYDGHTPVAVGLKETIDSEPYKTWKIKRIEQDEGITKYIVVDPYDKYEPKPSIIDECKDEHLRPDYNMCIMEEAPEYNHGGSLA